MFKYTIQNQITIDGFLKSFHLSKANIYILKRDNLIKVNGKFLASNSLNKGDEVTIDLSSFDTNLAKKKTGKLDIVFENEDFIIVNKEKDILTHSDSKSIDSLENYLTAYLNTKIRIVQRLDKDTTGIILFPKHLLSASYFSNLIENGKFMRVYLALVKGKMPKKEGYINLPIGKNRHKQNQYLVTKQGKPAQTRYKVLQEGDISLVSFEIYTGKTHQIRVHTAHIGNPIVGDFLYGEKEDQLYLHSLKIGFVNFRTKTLETYETKIPKRFYERMEKQNGDNFRNK